MTQGWNARLLAALLVVTSGACSTPDDGMGTAGAPSGGSGAIAGGGSGGGGGGGSVAGAGGSSGAGMGAAAGGTGGAGGAGLDDAGDSGASDASIASDAGDAGGAPSGWPDATNTGIPDGACPSGLRAATLDEIEPKSNAMIECVVFSDGVPYVRQEESNIAFRYCRFETTEDTFLNLQGGPVVIEDSEFVGPAGTWIRAVYESHGLTVRRCDFSGMANAIEFGTRDVVIEDNYVHDFGDVDMEQHADGFQTEGADGFTIRHNTVMFNEVWGSTSALLVSGDGALVQDNLLAGGGYTLHVAGDMQVTGNRFSTRFYDTCGFYGPIYPESLDGSGSWEDNLWYDGPNAGEPLPAP